MSTSKFEDHLWREFVREHGDDLAQLKRSPAGHGIRRPLVVSGAGLGLAGGATALALALSAASAPPAFAVTRNQNGTVTVTLSSASAIAGVNAKLHQLGIRAEVMAQAPVSCQAESVQTPTGVGPTPGPGTTPGPGSTGSANTTFAQWTFNQSATAGSQSVVLTPPPANNNVATATGEVWTCGGVPKSPDGGGTAPTAPPAGSATAQSGATGNSAPGA